MLRMPAMFWKTWWYRCTNYVAMRSIAALGLFACATLAVLPLGCSSLTVTSVQQASSAENLPVPTITADRLKGCVENYGKLLAPGSYVFRPKVRVDQKGRKLGVAADDIPITAYDFAACTRKVVLEMAIYQSMLDLMATPLSDATSRATAAQRSQMGVVQVVVAGVTFVLADLIIQASGITIVFAIAVEIAKDIGEALDERERCKRVREMCIAKCTDQAIPSGTWSGDPFFMCRRKCLEAEDCWGTTY